MAAEFEYYLRTGRRRGIAATPIETKFNPWHDAEDGRFTFAGQGRFFPGRGVTRRRTDDGNFTGGGGSFGGGGAGGSWGPKGASAGGGGASGTLPAVDRRSGGAPEPTIVVSAPSARPKVAAVRQQSRLTFNRNGYDFAVDAHARTRRVSGELRLQEHARSRSAQRNAGKPDRRLTDEGGHFIAARFNGPRDWFNHFAQDRNFNRSAYQSLENEWARTIGSGK